MHSVKLILRSSVAVIVLGALLGGCSSMKSYRQTKAGMLASQIEIWQMAETIDSLNKTCAAYTQLIEQQSLYIDSLSESSTRIKEEYRLLMEEFKKQETRYDEIQKSTAKTKRGVAGRR